MSQPTHPRNEAIKLPLNAPVRGTAGGRQLRAGGIRQRSQRRGLPVQLAAGGQGAGRKQPVSQVLNKSVGAARERPPARLDIRSPAPEVQSGLLLSLHPLLSLLAHASRVLCRSPPLALRLLRRLIILLWPTQLTRLAAALARRPAQLRGGRAAALARALPLQRSLCSPEAGQGVSARRGALGPFRQLL